jgi:glycogen debranching enzyme
MSVRAIERFALTSGALLYQVSHYVGRVQITLDMRQMHDFEQWGRHYTIQQVPGGQVVTYSCPRYTFCLAVLGAKAEWAPKWRSVRYDADARRQSNADYSVYDCLEFSCQHTLALRFGIGYTPQEAIAQANNTAPQRHHLVSPSRDAALQAAVADLDGLLLALPQLEVGILAGYPWFYQVYNRDEAISLGAVIALGRDELAKKILLRSLSSRLPDGRIANRFPTSEIGSADGVGWTYLRAHQLFSRGAFSEDEIRYIHQQLTASLEQLEQQHSAHGLITNGWKETWMDTTGGSQDGRAGARIEIQALTMRMYAFMAELCQATGDGDASFYRQRGELLQQTVRARFLDERGSLADGIDDHVDRTSRPNVFLACYAYPALLSDDEWHRAFSVVLRDLWLPWGALATISKDHLLFQPTHTGEQDKSYHRGDSWYFLNNIASMCLARFGYTEQAEQLYASSQEQLLRIGVPGHAAEISSAEQQEGLGCPSQAWSAATFVELFLERQDYRSQSSTSTRQ